MTEADMGQLFVQWLKLQGWEVYQEVTGPSGRADVYAVQGPVKWAIELKKTFSFKVIEQAYAWRYYANYVSVCVLRCRDIGFRYEICSHFGIGIIQYYPGRSHDLLNLFGEGLRPKIRRKISPPLLFEEQKDYALAGNAERKAYTPYAATRDRVIRRVKERPGITLKQLLQDVSTHYMSLGSAKQCICNDVVNHLGKYSELYAEKIKGKWRLFPADLPEKERAAIIEQEERLEEHRKTGRWI